MQYREVTHINMPSGWRGCSPTGQRMEATRTQSNEDTCVQAGGAPRGINTPNRSVQLQPIPDHPAATRQWRTRPQPSFLRMCALTPARSSQGAVRAIGKAGDKVQYLLPFNAPYGLALEGIKGEGVLLGHLGWKGRVLQREVVVALWYGNLRNKRAGQPSTIAIAKLHPLSSHRHC